MPTGSIARNAQVAGIYIQSVITRTGTGTIAQVVPLPAAKAGNLSTRTDNNTGVATLAGGHGIINTNVCNLFWSAGCRAGMVATVATNAVTLDGGAGDVLPAENSAVTVSKQVVIDTDFDGDLLEMIAMVSSLKAHVDFLDAGSAVLLAKDLTAVEDFSWVANTGVANPLTGNAVASMAASCGDSSAAATLTLGALYDSA